ncbi:MAG TPA: EAL domain-containing protein [Burkholderiaceae bacterium]|nr:EAL domain-containing protein [Burkholderiaceae bacterium]
MPERSLDTCVALCRRARDLNGVEQVKVLAELQRVLEEMMALLPQSVIRTVAGKLHGAADSESNERPLFKLDLTGYLIEWSTGAEQMFGYSGVEIIGQHVLMLYADDDEEIAELFLDKGTSVMEVRRRKKSGEVFKAGLSLSVVHDVDGDPIGLEVYLTEIFDRLSDQEKLRLHARIIEDSDQGIMITDAEERIISVNRAFSRITGYSPAEAIGQTPDLLRSGLHDADFRIEVRAAMHGSGPWQGEIVGRRKNGELFPQSVTISVVRNDNEAITHAFSIFSDISRHKEAEARLQKLANYDTVTGLPNRSLLDQLVGQALIAARRNNDHGALMVITLHRLSSINYTLGHEIGNAFLCQIVGEFRQTLRDEDVLARIDGDKLVVALLHIDKREHAGIVAQKLLSTLHAPFIVESHELHIDASIGISVYPEDGLDTEALTGYADVAMTRVHQSGETGFLFYSPEMNQRAKEHLRIEGELRHALAAGEMQLHYQPKVSLRNGRIVGAEALIRWQHPIQGMIAPGVFIAVAEETGLIMEIGSWVIEEACRQIRQWQDEKRVMPPIAINLSARQFDQNLPARIQATLERHQVYPEHLKLEITESLLVRGAENVISIMNQLVAMGLALALDDFGTGYSSLAYLKRFPISTLKIDRSFVIGLPEDQNDCAIARAIVTMALNLRQEIVAEGVETLEQMRFLRELGCDQLQGFLFSQPVSADQFAQMVADGVRLNLDK